ncbi:hypothetical protein IA539_11235 [Gordonia sp. zg691]|uniref:Ferredoxin n=1 Tax=Gordonia jinghuaiqii TaxID=2758710 RepID=A0A7D7LV39_9ACTN|nr:hypothetical protein [Gordonia jinghuaiqii]MBD0861780.1 hypothetical protein [Gordonia jinghuaiqii]MCR5977672.1 hypothetical protein [Gordonia jinghuaiqii]QMT02341.1 hypothetical protein H1R19_04040 [Gordonia jinghuaiqii]
MTRAVSRSPGWAKAPDFHDDPDRAARVQAATERDREHYLSGGMREIECRACHACVMVKKTSSFHTSVQWNADARNRCHGLEQMRAGGDETSGTGGNGPLLPGAMMPTCARLSASIDHGVIEGIIPAGSPDTDPDGYW